MHCATTKSTTEPSLLHLYREPGIGRISELDPLDLPQLSPIVKSGANTCLAAVTRKKGNWVKVIYDESGREGWLELARTWHYQSWERYLRGREVHILAGLRKDLTQLRNAPTGNAPALESVNRQKSLRVVEVSDGWMLVLVDLTSSGWIRWRDDDGRLLVSCD